MARIRSIKPEFFSSEQIVECSATARLLFVGMWCFCDDGGVHPASAARLKMEIFPADSFSAKDVAGWVEELKQAGLVEAYVVGGQEFWRVTGWHHQKIETPTYRHPRSREFGEEAARIRRGVVDASPPESRGDEGSRGESNGAESSGVESISLGDRKSIGKPPAREATPTDLSPPIGLSPKDARKGKRQKPHRDYQADLSEVDWTSVVSWSEAIGRKVPPRSQDDRRMWLKFAVLGQTHFNENWLVDSTEAVIRAKETRTSKQAHLVAVLEAKALEDFGIEEATFLALLGGIEIPKDIWKSGVLEIR